jgi:RNA polymerase sigma-70 factor (ECF subfamily)
MIRFSPDCNHAGPFVMPWRAALVGALFFVYKSPCIQFRAATGILHQTNYELLLIAVASGDSSAFDQLYLASSPRLFPICLKLLRDRDRASEVLQEAFVRIWQKAKLFDASKGDALAWMATLTRRCALDRLSEAKRDGAVFQDVDEEVIASTVAEIAVGPPDTAALRSCLQKLDQKHSRALLLVYCFGLTHEELAANLSVPLGTAKSWVNRGMTDLRKCMG